MKPQARRRPLAPVPSDAQQYAVPMRDGTLLATDVYLPPGATPSDVVLSRLPYDKDGDEFFMPAVAHYWVALGYAVVVQDVRGKGRSGGDFQPGTTDADDAYDTIDWIVRQSWSRGRVAMIGDSYAGFTQWCAASRPHPALVAITPRSAAHDRGAQRFEGDVLALETSVYWAAETAIDEYLYDYPEPFDWSARPIAEVVTREVGSPRPRWIDDWATDETTYDASAPMVDAHLGVLHVCGLFDHGVVPQYRTWELANSVYPHHRLVLDAVDHSWRALLTSGSDSVVLEDRETFLSRYLAEVKEFVTEAFAPFAGGGDLVRWRPALDVPWRAASEWPPAESMVFDLWLAGEPSRQLVVQRPQGRSVATWLHDPTDPVPSRGYAFHELAERHDLSDLAERHDLLQFVGEPLIETLELAGNARFAAQVTSTAPRSTLVVSLLDVTPDGRTWEVRTGRARMGTKRPPTETTVDMGPVSYQFLPGHRIGLRISSSLYPRLALDSGNSSNTWDTWTPTTATQSIVLGGTGGARMRCASWDATVGES